MEIIGNVSILKKHLEDQGLEVVLDKKTIGEEVNFNEYNFIFTGSGTEKNLDVVLKDLQNILAERLKLNRFTSLKMYLQRYDFSLGKFPDNESR